MFYPKGGVSKIQELQMVTQKGENTHVVAIHGNFDDAQSGVKNIFNNSELREKLSANGFRFSSANSINIGRLVPQIVYYVYAYCRMIRNNAIKSGEAVNVCVPTGNFGNILAAYYAKLSGVPISKLICASNENKVLFDFFATGDYDRNREFILTTSPSMDILISSNLERLIYRICGDDWNKNLELMRSLSENGKYSISEEMKDRLSDFYGNYACEAENFEGISKVYSSTGYVMDTHTGIASAVYEKYKAETGDATPTIIASTASPFKFSPAVINAIDPSFCAEDDFDYIERLKELSKMAEPYAIKQIRNAQIRHEAEADPEKMPETVLGILGI